MNDPVFGPTATIAPLRKPRGMKERWAVAQQRCEAGDLKAALEIFKSIAADGYVEAYVEVGHLYELGEGGVACDLAQAEAWYRKGVESMDDPYAHLGLGRLYYNGIGLPRDRTKALEHLLKAESIQHPQGLVMLGVLYHLGAGASIDLNRAYTCYLAAAHKELVLAMQYLSVLEFHRRRYLSGIWWRLKTVIAILRIGMRNPDDWRLSGLRDA